jgi:hypothetical protein
MTTYTAVTPNFLDKIISLGDGRVILSADDTPVVTTVNLSPLSLAGTPLIDLPDPTTNQGAATKAYVDSSKIAYLTPVRALGAVNLALSGNGPWSIPFSTTIDGLTLAEGNLYCW